MRMWEVAFSSFHIARNKMDLMFFNVSCFKTIYYSRLSKYIFYFNTVFTSSFEAHTHTHHTQHTITPHTHTRMHAHTHARTHAHNTHTHTPTYTNTLDVCVSFPPIMEKQAVIYLQSVWDNICPPVAESELPVGLQVYTTQKQLFFKLKLFIGKTISDS